MNTLTHQSSEQNGTCHRITRARSSRTKPSTPAVAAVRMLGVQRKEGGRRRAAPSRLSKTARPRVCGTIEKPASCCVKRVSGGNYAKIRLRRMCCRSLCYPQRGVRRGRLRWTWRHTRRTEPPSLLRSLWWRPVQRNAGGLHAQGRTRRARNGQLPQIS